MIRTVKNYFHFIEALIANVAYQYPSTHMTVIGVTGTDGKTTTSSMIAHILSENGFKTAVITTVGATINGTFYETGFHTTTPSSFYLQKYLSMAKKAGCTHVVIETTSHALHQYRTLGISFEIGVITNITHEHLDYHKTLNKYMKAKSILLKRSKIKFLNFDDPIYADLRSEVPEENRYYYSLHDTHSYVLPNLLPKKIQKLGEFNMQNALAAACASKAVGVSEKDISNALQSFQLPEGRMEIVHNNSFQVVIDFAHTPNSIAKVLPQLKEATQGKLIHVFGAAGKRDATKRREMGRASASIADIIVLTAEDPRGEDVISICNQIRSGISGFKELSPKLIVRDDTKYFVIIPNRKNAIEFAIHHAKKGDIVVLTGKGHEKSMNINGLEEPWSDKEAVFESLEKLSHKA